ncbi:sulfatase-like hydrolase/transferase [Roseiconus nitratireducens]|uniref:Sulfatase-like hydrolase/transferase n=1 Tax=Roseiconus nitratireducens TaxID=2605748 RepID=A0A5M6DLW9_9BACT|nr:sulfatase-like hydrolase/transferase [Roseiconus nitratireducens]KAA5547219.1 sulfatase-like hydrolase/transferase [Roseiconus nitratireducens]
MSVFPNRIHHRRRPRPQDRSRRNVLAIVVAAIAVIWLQTLPVRAEPADRPNILLILADDMGYGDLGCMGSQTLRTPHLDALAADGVLCTRAYVASAVCSPSRAGLLTGRDPRRFGYEGNLNASASNYATRPELLGLPPNEHTLGDHLRAAGYATGIVGKWHLGVGQGFHPNERGFDYFCGMLGGSHHYFPATMKHSIERNGIRVKEFSSDYLTDFFTDEGIRFINQRSNDAPDQPWFLYMSYNAPHTPMQALPADLAKFESIEDEKRRTYAAMMFALDRGVGRLMEHLRATDQDRNTLVVFFSDNGGATNNASWNGPLRGVKGCLREGGIRVPMIWSWPDRFPSGTTSDAVMSSLDLLPTFLAAAERDPLPLAEPMSHEDARNRRRMLALMGPYDGTNLLPQLGGQPEGTSRTLFWRLQGQAAVLQGSEKLIRLSHRPAQLFRLGTDAGESQDLAAAQLDRTKALFELLGEWESKLPTVPLWGSSPYWSGDSAKHYDGWAPRKEPETD